ncbi:L-amino acid N-acyltransferase YncA [Fontibacillus phaseoli]|uniref:L-amino acid N-acyltransferase YncA n=1 Tax=Fontibacillus phaseoli TaxID=1416533 RepID=A0A369B8S2_9BACL|nr:GNAT family N-acetyltransferase [Fontibacillus phaseoli]RCX17715.1 L-amino acid N-acyltransferase YncA [Fontibacillus phaseoli]
MNIREARIEDYENIAKLHLQLHELHVANRPDLFKHTANYPLDFAYFKSCLDNDIFNVFIVEDERSGIIAYTILKVEETPAIPVFVVRRILYINDICVDIQFQGKGVGKRLFKQAIDYARESGAESLELGVSSFNESAIEFYKAMGMKTKSLRMELDIEK